MRVGHGSAPLPVPAGTAMGGYAARAGGASGVLDELQVDCVSFGGVGGRFVLVVAEVLCINEDLAAAVRQQVRSAVGEPVVDVWVTATHTHAGPDVGCVPGGGTTPATWHRAVTDAAVDAARRAVAAERACAGRFHAGVLRDVGSVRGEERAVARVSVDVVSCADADGRLAGVLAVVPVHPTVLPASSTLVSGDLTAAIRRSLRHSLQTPWVVVATGAAGDISTRRTRRAQTAAECVRLGDEAARQIAALLRVEGSPLWDARDGACSAARRRLAIAGRRQDRHELDALRARLEDERARGMEGAARVRTLETALQGVEIARTRRAASTVPLPLSAARIGGLALLGIGAEPFHDLGDDLRDRCPGPSVLLGYANGHAGYLPDAAAFATTGYEVLASPFPSTAAASAVASLIDLLPDPPED